MAEKINEKTNVQSVSMNSHLETRNADRRVWLMKCPSVVSRFFEQHQQSSSAADNDLSFISPGPVAKVTVVVDPLLANDATQFTMDLTGTSSKNMPTHYSMDMSTNFIPMSIFSESTQGRLSVEGKIYHKFDMKPHHESIENYGKLCRERTNKYMTKNRQIQVIDNDNAKHMRPMPGYFATKAFGSADKKKVSSKGLEMKRTRRDRDEMEEILFKLFERQSNWTLKHLSTGAPLVRGQNKGLYEWPAGGSQGVGRTLREIPPAHYTLKVDSFSFLVQLLEKTGEKSYESEVFEASGHKWKLCLYPTGDEEKGGKGHISLYLAITNTQALPLGWEVNASFKFFVFDQYRGKYLTIQDVNEKPRRYHAMKTQWGFPELLPISVFNDPTKGYLVGDKCVFGVEVFVIKYSGAGELLPQPTNRTSSCFTWNIHNYSFPTGAVRTQSFVLEACNWTLELHPKGFLGDRPNHFALAFFLDVTKNTPKVYADFKLTIKNQADGKDITLPGSQWFFPNKRWITGVPHKLSPVSDVSKGFLVNDLLVVNFEITRIFAVEKFA